MKEALSQRNTAEQALKDAEAGLLEELKKLYDEWAERCSFGDRYLKISPAFLTFSSSEIINSHIQGGNYHD